MGHGRIVTRGVDDGSLGQDAYTALDGGSRKDCVVRTAPPGFPPRPRSRGAGTPGAFPATIVERGGRRAKYIDLGRRVARLLESQHGGGVDLRQVLEDGDVGVKARTV